jgi:hypothetical protein
MAAFRTIKDNVEGPIWGAVLTSASQPSTTRSQIGKIQSNS